MIKLKDMLRLCIATAAVAVLGINHITYAQSGQVVVKDGTYASVKIENGNFVGDAWMQNLITPHEPSKVYSASVTFAPGARTNWHSHPMGQSLIVTSGIGYTQEWGKPIQVMHVGDVVWCPPNIKHWHGAAPDSMMTHIAVSEKSDKSVSWFAPVSDEEYLQK